MGKKHRHVRTQYHTQAVGTLWIFSRSIWTHADDDDHFVSSKRTISISCTFQFESFCTSFFYPHSLIWSNITLMCVYSLVAKSARIECKIETRYNMTVNAHINYVFVCNANGVFSLVRSFALFAVDFGMLKPWNVYGFHLKEICTETTCELVWKSMVLWLAIWLTVKCFTILFIYVLKNSQSVCRWI